MPVRWQLLARFGSAAQGDPIYEAGVQLGRLLRTAFLADYFVKDAFRNELRRVLNRGEAVNALKRAHLYRPDQPGAGQTCR
ncbi:transposase Tn3 family protein [Alicycliphilus sp. B1]|nr:transposase Tn3 family protein [Alicycliphilus sp. B1]